ncbi:MAG: hypothetical protein RL885_14625 [Planctomycetota bacterium]
MNSIRIVGACLVAITTWVGSASLAWAQTNQQTYHNGVEYFFKNTFAPPSPVATYTRAFGSATSIGSESGGVEGNVHAKGVQQDGFEAWSGQVNATPSLAMPLGFSLMEFRRGGNFSRATGSIVAVASWTTSLPCSVPWFWVVTFTWATPFTQTSSVLNCNSRQNFTFSMRGEAIQSIGNQNYWTGSGNERNLNTGGISFLEDTIVNTAFQLPGRQEWSHSYFQLDATTQTNRDPSGMVAGSFGFDPTTVGTGGTILRTLNTQINPGAPRDAHAIRHEARQQMTGISNTVLSLISITNLGGGLSPDSAFGPLKLPGDPRRFNLCTPQLFLPPFMTTGGAYGGLTGDVGLSGQAQTIPLDLSLIIVPPPLQPLGIATQAVGIQLPSFSFLTSGDRYQLN